MFLKKSGDDVNCVVGGTCIANTIGVYDRQHRGEQPSNDLALVLHNHV